MPRAFNDREEKDIRDRLRREGRRLFSAHGVLKTSIETITTSVGIAKGTFYKFYASKEILFFELLEDSQNKIRAPLIHDSYSGKAPSRADFETLLHSMFKAVCDDPLIQFMGRENELLAISRKVPPDTLISHQKDDQDFLETLSAHWNTRKKSPPRDRVAARITTFMLVSLNRGFIGERLTPHAEEAVVASLADCFFEPAHKESF